MSVSRETQLCISIAKRPSNFGVQFHNIGYELLGLDWLYLPRQVNEDQLEEVISSIVPLEIRGCGVSMPHKKPVIKYLDLLDASAKKVGSVNTIKNDDGKLIGYNTDYYGAKQALSQYDLKDKKVVMIGAGGVAQAVGFAAIDLGAQLTIINRTKSKADDLAKTLNADVLSWENLNNIQGDVLINTTSIGMHDESQSVVDKEVIERFHIIKDVVIEPNPTRLITLACELGKKTIDGQQMCYYQAAAQFEIYTKSQPPIDEIRKRMDV